MIEFAPLPTPRSAYSVLYADPPWQYREIMHHAGVESGSARKHYTTIALDDLKALKPALDEVLAADCLLYLWSTGAVLPEALELGKAWGFKYATIAFVWVKPGAPTPGYYTMSSTEQCLVFKRGKIPQPRGSRNERQLVHAARAGHSSKPEEVALRIERMFPAVNGFEKLELFARGAPQRTGDWRFWGDETESA